MVEKEEAKQKEIGLQKKSVQCVLKETCYICAKQLMNFEITRIMNTYMWLV
jgi:hypothetical protein